MLLYLSLAIYIFTNYKFMIKKLLQPINKIIDHIFVLFIWFYQKTLSPDKGILSFWLKGRVCAHEPHCSEYAVQHIKRYGWIRSLAPVTDRVFNCTPSHTKKYDPVSYKVVFFSSAKIGIPFLESLIKDDRFDIVWVVTQPDQPSWRWLQTQPNIIKSRVQHNHPYIDIYTPAKINPDRSKDGRLFYDWLADKKSDYLVVISYGKIIPLSILDLPNIAPINVHGSLLPAYRGASPIQSVFLDNQAKTGITIMYLDAWLDTWDIVSHRSIDIDFTDTTADIITKFEQVWPDFLNKTLVSYAKWDLCRIPQDETQVILTTKIDKEDGYIDLFTTDIQTIYNKYRAYYLRPKIRFVYKDKRYIIEKMTLDRPLFQANIVLPLFTDNIIDKNHIHPAIKELIIKPEWKKSISYQDWFHSLQS